MKGFWTQTAGALLVSGTFAIGQTPAPAAPDVHPHPSAPSPAPMPEFRTGGGNSWFGQTQLDLGTVFEGEEAVGEFKFKNPHAAEHRLTQIAPGCQCTKALIQIGAQKYEVGADKVVYRVGSADGAETRERVNEVRVAPGEEGGIEVHMSMVHITGPKESELSLQTSDPALPAVSLKWRAIGAVYFEVSPPEVHLNEMTWADQREFEFTITSPLKDDFNLISHEPLSTGMRVEYAKEMKDGKAVWRVKGTYGPGALERDNGGMVTFKTDIQDRSVSARVSAALVGPLTMKPGGFISLGHIDSAEGKEVELTLTPNGGFDLQVENLEIGRLKLSGKGKDQRDALKFSHRKDGNDVKVVIAVEKGMQEVYFSGTLKVHLNHPAAPMKEVMFNGFVH